MVIFALWFWASYFTLCTFMALFVMEILIRIFRYFWILILYLWRKSPDTVLSKCLINARSLLELGTFVWNVVWNRNASWRWIYMEPFLHLSAGELTRILALGYVLMAVLFDCFEIIPNSGSAEDPSVSARRDLEETYVNSIQIRRQLINVCWLTTNGKL